MAERTHALSLANEQLRDLDRLKSEFLATMSHELRTPLNSVLGFTSLLLDGRSPLTDEQRRQLGHVRAAGRHLLALINDVLDLSRLESGHMALTLAPVDVVELAREAVEQLRPAAQAKGLALHTRLPTSLSVLADRRRLLQVLLNLGSNAIKFTPSGEVRLFAEAGDAHDPQVRLGVEDTGIGIAPEHLDKLFKPFHQVDSSMSRQHEGTGLGLHLSQRLVGLMHGRIDVRSTPGAGSCFTVWLPAAPLDAAAGE